MIPAGFLERLRDAVPLSSVVQRDVRLKRAGKEFTACCPFHAEKTPSFTVSDEKGLYFCFGCGANGDVIGYAMRTRRLSFVEAVEELARDAGLELPQVTPEQRAQDARRRDLYAVVEAAQAWFRQQLRGASAGAALAREYLAGRGLDDEDLERWGIGWAPDDGAALRRHLTGSACKFPEEDAVEAGVLRLPEVEEGRQRAPYAFFRGRVTFPIADRRGRVVAWTGRLLDGDGPKYINTADTPLFDKGRLLYGLSRMRRAARDGHRPLIVEGVLDVIQAVKAGFQAAVAPLGTALTADQLGLVWKLMPPARPQVPVLALDGDAAGRAAAERAVERALPLIGPDRSLSIAFLPDGEDPDTLLRKEGAAALAAVVDAARPLSDMLWETLTAGRAFDTPEARAGLQAQVERTLGTIADPGTREAYKGDFATRLAKPLGRKPKLGLPKGPPPPGAGPDAWDEDCPVMVLGSRGDWYHYLSPRRELRSLKYDKHNDAGIASIFGGDTDWLMGRFPRLDNGVAVGVNNVAARNWLFRQANDLPVFEAEKVLRGPGLWPDDAHGVIVHCGDELRVAGERRPAGCRIGRHVYPREVALPPPADEPGPPDDWVWLWDFLLHWSWRDPPRDALVQVGWQANGMLAGLAPWNCPNWVRGTTGSGKTTLLKLHRGLLGDGWAIGVSEPSEAAVRQTLGPSARVVLIDEIEPEEVGTRARDVAHLVRLATDPDQAPTRRGSVEGKAIEYPIRAVLYFTSTLVPALAPQDLNRITICELDELRQDAVTRETIRQTLPNLVARGARMRARMLARWPDFHTIRSAFEAGLARGGHKGRSLDQVGTLLASAFLALFDGTAMLHEKVAEWAELFPPDERLGVDESNSDARRCLQHLLTAGIEKVWMDNCYRRRTLGQLVNERRDGTRVRSDIGPYGVGVWQHPESGRWCLVVANNHGGLEEIFTGTIWRGGVWRQSLGQLPGAMKSAKTLSFAGDKQKGTWIPLDLIPDGRDAADEDQEAAVAEAARVLATE